VIVLQYEEGAMKKKVIKGGVILIVILIVLFSRTERYVSDETPECELMKPLPVETDAHYRELDFSDKTILSPNKYGFRKKLVIDEDSIVIQQVGGSPAYSKTDTYYGIYRDEKLKEPIEEVDFMWQYRDGPFEEGLTDTIPYDEKKDGIVVLEPGTYYAAVYTKAVLEDFTASYLSYICPLNERSELGENEVKKFYVVKEDQKNTFTISPEKSGRVRVEIAPYNQGTVSIYDESRGLLCKKSVDEDSDEPLTVVFPVEKGQTYYAEIEDGIISTDSWFMDLYEIKYTYI